MSRSDSDLATRISALSFRSRPAIVGVDGPGGAGKSSLAIKLAVDLKHCTVVHFDDFYLPGVVQGGHGYRFDWRRLEHQVLIPARKGEATRYERLDWSTGCLSPLIRLAPTEFLIVEGVYALRAELRSYYDFRILVTAPYSVRLRRGVERDGEAMRSTWTDSWMPEESEYFASPIGPSETSVDAVVDGTDLGEA